MRSALRQLCIGFMACAATALHAQTEELLAHPAAVDQQRLAAANQDPGQWMSHGRDWTEQRFSPLKQINDSNVSRLGLAWFAELNTYRGVDATPLEIDGVLYNVSAWDITTAYDATNGKVLWTFDPRIPLEWGRLACCGPVSRGLAAWRGKIYHRRARWPPDRFGCEDRQDGVEHADLGARTAAVHHRRTAHRRRSGRDRQWRWRFRRTRLYLGL